jgi:hypothetical protein
MIDIPLEGATKVKVNPNLEKILNIIDKKPIQELPKFNKFSKRTITRLKNVKRNCSTESIKHLLDGKFSISFADNYIHNFIKKKEVKKEEIKQSIDTITGKIATKEYLFAYEEFFKQIRLSRSNKFTDTDKELILKHIDNIRAYVNSKTNGFNHINERS